MIFFALLAKHKLYRAGFTLDHLRSFVWAAWRLYARSYCAHDTPSKSRTHFTVVTKYAISSGTDDGYARDNTPTNAAKRWTHCKMSATGLAGFLGHSERPALSSTSFCHVSGNSSLISTNSNRTIFVFETGRSLSPNSALIAVTAAAGAGLIGTAGGDGWTNDGCACTRQTLAATLAQVVHGSLTTLHYLRAKINFPNKPVPAIPAQLRAHTPQRPHLLDLSSILTTYSLGAHICIHLLPGSTHMHTPPPIHWRGLHGTTGLASTAPQSVERSGSGKITGPLILTDQLSGTPQ